MKGKRLIIVLIVVALFLAFLVAKFVKKSASKKIEIKTFGGLTKEEFERKLQEAWKDHYYKVVIDAIRLPEEWAREWRLSVDEAVVSKDIDFETALLEAAQFAYAKDNPKASQNAWSSGWLSEVYVRGKLGLDPNDPKIKEVILTI